MEREHTNNWIWNRQQKASNPTSREVLSLWSVALWSLGSAEGKWWACIKTDHRTQRDLFPAMKFSANNGEHPDKSPPGEQNRGWWDWLGHGNCICCICPAGNNICLRPVVTVFIGFTLFVLSEIRLCLLMEGLFVFRGSMSMFWMCWTWGMYRCWKAKGVDCGRQ